MAAPGSLPQPKRNLTEAKLMSAASGIVAADIIVAVGDYTGGASEDMFTLSSHGLVTGDWVTALYQTAMGAITGGEGTRGFVKRLGANTFQVCSEYTGTTVIENTADGTVVFLKGRVSPEVVKTVVIPYLIFCDWDYTGGTVEDMGTPAQGTHGLYEGDTLKLLFKSAAGVTAGTLNTTYYAKDPTVTYFQIAATSGGAVIDSTADGTAVFLKTS